ncbi:MAG: TetR/AcrR family transcriptional regulator [Deltaproteobacteria bacterium]|nr:MAG: TetR/AcrR family transcriptional regulator [Deltaproteobacteria bacterium]
MNAVAAKQPEAVLRWVRPPQQARTRESLTRLLDAAEDLVSERGFDEASVADITRRARSSVGGFYRRFRDKQGLLHALHERFCEEAQATADEAFDPERWRGADAGLIIDAFVSFLVEIYREKAGLLRAFLVQAALDTSVRERTEALFEYLVTGLSVLLEARREEIGHPDPAMASEFGMRVVLGTMNSTIQLQTRGVGIDDPRFEHELARVFKTYLCVATDPLQPVAGSSPKGR